MDCTGNVITGAARVGTGAKVNLLENGKIIDTVTVIVPGDVDGNGVINTADQNAVKSSMRRAVILNEYQREAADVDGNGTVNINDYQRIKAHALGKQDLYALI